MSLVIPVGYGQASIEFLSDYDPDPWYTTFGVDLSETGGDYEGAATSCAQSFETAFQSLLSNEVVITACELRVGQDASGPLLVRVNRGNRGASTGDKLPQNCALLLRKNTARAGRTGRGRMYLPGILQENKVSQTGIIDPTEVATLEDAADDFRAFLAVGGLGIDYPTPMVLLHNALVPGGTDPDPVTSLVPDNRIATQRRRLR